MHYKIIGASKKFKNQPRPLVRPSSVNCCQPFWNLSHETVPLKYISSMYIIPILKKASNGRTGLLWKCRLIKVPQKNRSHPLVFSLSLIILEQSLMCATESSREKKPLPQVRHTCSDGSPATCNGLSVNMTCSSFASWLMSSVLMGGWS